MLGQSSAVVVAASTGTGDSPAQTAEQRAHKEGLGVNCVRGVEGHKQNLILDIIVFGIQCHCCQTIRKLVEVW